jgi:hypothetical protein
VSPLRGVCSSLIATGGFAALHPRLFDLCRSAADCRIHSKAFDRQPSQSQSRGEHGENRSYPSSVFSAGRHCRACPGSVLQALEKALSDLTHSTR